MAGEDQGFVLGPREGKTVEVGGDPFIFKVVSANTGGAYSLVEVTVGLHGPPLHVHRNEDEAWYVLDGDFEMRIGERIVRATPGSLVFGPKGVPHHYTKLSEGPGKLLEIFSPAGFERCFEELAGLTDVGRMREIALQYQMEILGPPIMH